MGGTAAIVYFKRQRTGRSGGIPLQCDDLQSSMRHSGTFHFGNLKKLTARRMIGNNATVGKYAPLGTRLPVDMPVRVVTSKGFSDHCGRGPRHRTERRRHGLVHGILLNRGDLLEIEFDTPTLSRMLLAIVRSRNVASVSAWNLSPRYPREPRLSASFPIAFAHPICSTIPSSRGECLCTSNSSIWDVLPTLRTCWRRRARTVVVVDPQRDELNAFIGRPLRTTASPLRFHVCATPSARRLRLRTVENWRREPARKSTWGVQWRAPRFRTLLLAMASG